MVISNLSAMKVREDLKSLTYEELKEREKNNDSQERAFQRKYASDAWRYNEAIKKERDAINDEGRALRTAIMMGGFKQVQLKPHCIALDQPVMSIIEDDESEIQMRGSLKKYLRRIVPVDELDDQSIEEGVGSNSNNNGTQKVSFEDIFNAAVVKKSSTGNSPKKLKLIDQDKLHSRDEKSLEEQIADLRARQDALFDNLNGDLAKIAEESDEIEDQLQELRTQLEKIKKAKL